MRKIIGIIGKKRTGKDTLAEYISLKYGGVKFTLGKAVKEVCKALFRFSDEQLYGERKEKIDSWWGISPRQAFQCIGTEIVQFVLPEKLPEYGKAIGRTHWCHLVLIDMDTCVYPPSKPYIITDIRFKHELEFFKDRFQEDFVTIKLTRETGFRDPHASEMETEKLYPDYILSNDGSLPQLYKLFDSLRIL